MYTYFYGLKEKPFNLTPSPRFLYLGETHKEALSLLTYGVMERMGFVLLTGEVGSGKTTIVQTLLRNLDSSVKYVYLSNPTLSAKDFLFYVASGLDLRTQFSSKGPFLVQLEDFLQKSLQHQQNVLLIADEAQNLSFELLEEIRLLSNMETADKKLINIFLIGQPELNEKLSQPICRPLLQRIGIRYHIKPLDLESTQEYIETRLKIAGAENGYKIFPKSAIRVIHQYSEGYPRMINILADNLLLLGYSEGKKKITAATVKACYQDMILDRSLPGKKQQSKDTSGLKKEPSFFARNYWKWAVVLLMILIVALVMGKKRQGIVGSIAGLIPISSRAPLKETSKEQLSAPAVQTEEKQAGAMNIIPAEESNETESTFRTEDKGLWKSVIVKKGDTLSKLTAIVYGQVNENNLKLVHMYNPEIEDISRIAVGQKIIFPALSALDQSPTFTVHIASFTSFIFAQEVFQKLKKMGHKVYIIPGHNARKGKIYKVTLGNFKDPQEAQDFASKILKKGIFDYAKTIRMEMR